MRLFSKARKFSERYGGAVIFMDELDAIGSRGGVVQSMEPYPFHEPFRHGLEDRLLESQGEEPRRSGVAGFVDRVLGGMGMGGMLVNELLVQMDGLIQPRGLRRFLRRLIPLTIRKCLRRKVPTYNILVIGATNRADSLDPALLRPDRFDRRLHVGLPDKEGRKDIAGYYLNNVRHDDIDLEKLAKATAFGTIPNELAGGSSIGAMLRDTAVREEVSEILAEARKEIEDLLRDKSAIVEGVRDALLQREDIDRLFARLEARGEPQGSGVV
jgi:SpoVK/Ycf46/Vps4 family AAA+-type ATPase